MKEKFAYFKIRFNEQIQYKASAFAGIMTQFAFGAMYLMIYSTFMKNGNTDMTIPQMAAYIWLGQAFLELLQTWNIEKDIFEQIRTGNIVMDLVKPSDIYNMWYYKSLVRKLARLILRMVPLLIITALPIWGEYRFMIQTNPRLLILSIISLFFTLLLNMSYIMLIYAFSMIFISSLSIRQVMRILLEIGSGLVIPLPFMPDWVISILKCTPFYYFQNISFSIYIGYMTNPKEIAINLVMQVIWVIALTFVGKAIVKNRLTKLVVQGG